MKRKVIERLAAKGMVRDGKRGEAAPSQGLMGLFFVRSRCCLEMLGGFFVLRSAFCQLTAPIVACMTML